MPELVKVFRLTINGKEIYTTDEKDVIISIRNEIKRLKVGYSTREVSVSKELIPLEEYKTKKHCL